MGVDFGLDDEGKEVLKGLSTYFASKVSHLQEVKLGKLIYITQLYHYANYRELFTKIPFFSLSRGPHAPAIRSVLKEQLENREIYVKVARSTNDPFNPCLILRSHKLGGKRFSAKWLNTAEEVVEEWGEKRFEEILDYTARTIPFLSTRYRDTIDMTKIELADDLKSVLSLPERNRIHRFVMAPENDRVQDSGRKGSKTVTVREVAEIYLSLCGDLPEKIPFRKHLGFSVCEIIQALEDLVDENNTVTDNYNTDIDRAAQLTGKLIHSSCFREVNYKVSLKTGMLFLKRNGYCFKKGELEKKITGTAEYQSLKEWFARVSTRTELK
jgi:prophage maintenance system killer protein